LITPEEIAARKTISAYESLRYEDNDVHSPSLHAWVQYDGYRNLPPTQIPYGRFLVHHERNDGVALLYIDDYQGHRTREYKHLTLSHQWVQVQTYTFNNEKRRWEKLSGPSSMTYEAYLSKKKRHPNWKAVVVDMRDRLGRGGHNLEWQNTFEKIVADSVRDAEEWLDLARWLNPKLLQ
jgi:hypothetical protein